MQLNGINRLPMPTWGWLKMNDTSLETEIEGVFGKEPLITGAEAIRIDKDVDLGPVPGILPDMEEMRALVADQHNCALTLTIPKGMHLAEPVIITFQMDGENRFLSDYIHIRAEEGSSATVVIQYRGTPAATCLHNGFTYLEGYAGAKVKLIKAQMLYDKDVHLDVTAARLSEGELLLCEMGAVHSVASCNLLLEGRGSVGNLDGLYIGDGRKKQDFNYRIEYRGQETEGYITVKGALAGQAHKALKSTIDFVTGAAGAKGREEESVLVLGDQAVNLSAPLLLCSEDNVEGEHATSTGKPDGEKLFYLMSRGFTEQEAKQLLVEASFTPLLNKVELEELREDLVCRIQGVIHGDS